MAVYEYEMENGTIEKVSLSMSALYGLQRRAPDLYMRYKQIYEAISRGNVDELLMAETIYIGYRAANLETDCMEFEEFLEAMSDSRESAGETFSALFGESGKKKDSVMPSARRRGGKRKHR